MNVSAENPPSSVSEAHQEDETEEAVVEELEYFEVEFGRCGQYALWGSAELVGKAEDRQSVDRFYKTGGLLDSGAPASVCGMGWLTAWAGSVQELGASSGEMFRFGDGKGVRSECTICLKAFLRPYDDDAIKVYKELLIDVVPGPIPLLISYETLCDWRRKIDFVGKQIILGSDVLKTGSRKSGRVFVRMAPASSCTSERLSKTSDRRNSVTNAIFQPTTRR